MARISTYGQDPNVQGSDRIIGTDGSDKSTKNFSVTSLTDFLRRNLSVPNIGYTHILTGSASTVNLNDFTSSVAVLITAPDSSPVVDIGDTRVRDVRGNVIGDNASVGTVLTITNAYTNGADVTVNVNTRNVAGAITNQALTVNGGRTLQLVYTESDTSTWSIL